MKAHILSMVPLDFLSFGMLRLRDLPQPVHVFQFLHTGLPPALLEAPGSALGGKREGEPIARLQALDLYELPTLPVIVVQALKVMHDPSSTAAAVERVIIHDPAISAKILRVANSGFFGFSRRVATIAEAVRVLGFANVQGIIISVDTFDAFRSERLNLHDFWRHSIATANAARFLSSKVRCSPDEAFMAGLLHDIGKLIFAIQSVPVYRRILEIPSAAPVNRLQAERALFEFTHPEVGAMLAESWDLPPRYVAAIAHHHDPAAAGAERAFCALIGGEQWDDCLQHLRQARPAIDAFVGAIRIQ